ncbi:MAG TPA: phosphoribosylpyrophosphate synthetase [Chitinophagaceae bacterium]|nr:phosphoribosylpyrophosphate synthetase [Chitinophagaceae bacterium]
MKNYETITDALNDLRKRGYDADFQPNENCLYSSLLDLRLYEEDFTIDETYRFEKSPNTGNTVVIYALSSPTGVKGTIVDDIGNYANILHPNIAKKLNDQAALIKNI